VTEHPWSIALVPLSDSFRASVAELARELRAGVVVWSPADDPAPPPGAAVLLILAGGSEGEALDLLADLPPAGAPVYLVGAMPDHRLAAAAVQRGARDYFALPEDFDILRRSLEREAREATGRVEAGRFAEAERSAVGFETILGRSAALRQTLDQAARVASHRDVTVLIGG
jgi:DNA-binding NtrC family response regulator